jgi:transcriptional regulator with XRE-family HTH domain
LIKNRFQELLAVLEREQGRKYSQREIAEITGLTRPTISAIASNQVQRYDVETVSRLVKFLGVDVTDFFVQVPDDEPGDEGFIEESSEELALEVG